MEKIAGDFLNDDFFEKLFKVKYPEDLEDLEKLGNLRNLPENKTSRLFDRVLEFAHECYIHGITVGMNLAIEIFEENNK